MGQGCGAARNPPTHVHPYRTPCRAPPIVPQARPIPVDVLDEEYDTVHQAFATDGEDQSPWMYYRQVKAGRSLGLELHVPCLATGNQVYGLKV